MATKQQTRWFWGQYWNNIRYITNTMSLSGKLRCPECFSMALEDYEEEGDIQYITYSCTGCNWHRVVNLDTGEVL